MADSTRDMRRSVYERDLKAKFGNLKLTEITHEDLRALTDAIVERGAPATAVHAREIVYQVYRWAIERGQKVQNPAELVRPSTIAKFRPRDRALTPDEIALMCQYLERIGTSPSVKAGSSRRAACGWVTPWLPSAGRLASRTKTSPSWKASVTGGPRSRRGLNDRSRYQRRVRGDETGSGCERHGLVERPDPRNPVHHYRHVAELLFGIQALPQGKRRDLLDGALDDLLALFQDRVLPFDADAARHYARLAVSARNGGRGFPAPDGYIAAIAVSRGFIVASRDTAPFEAAGVNVINPWRGA